MVNHPPPFQQKKKSGGQRKTRREEKDKTNKEKRKTQWCSGITCVLAGLRAHYPEHQHREEEKRKRKRKRTLLSPPSHTALPPNTNHHRYPTMTQPCHKNTPLNQQHCDNKHTRGQGKKVTRHSSRKAHHPAIHNTHHHTSPHTTHNTRGSKTMQGEARQHSADPIQDGTPQHTPLPPFNRATGKRQGGYHHTDGGSPSHTPPFNTMPLHLAMPPTTQRYPHPPPRTGGRQTRIPHHTKTTERYSPTLHHSTWQRDSSMT